jgi:hypothetical protein
MAKSNLERLIQLADEVFDMKNDPHQLNVDQDVIRRLSAMHPSTLSVESTIFSIQCKVFLKQNNTEQGTPNIE